jgi:protein O-GlcNAc transferase
VAGSLVSAAGLAELATSTRADFEALAIRIASNPGQARSLKERLAAARGHAPLFNNALFTQNLEQLYEQMYQRHLQSLPPAVLTPEHASR